MWYHLSFKSLRALIASSLLVLCTVAAAAAAYSVANVMDAILKVESGGNPYALNDNTTRRSYKFTSKDEAVTMANYLISLNHNIDMGLYQINSIQLSRGWDVSQLFDGGYNRSKAETIFNEWLAAARKKFGDTVLAWQRAIGGYNGGFAGMNNGNPPYETKVLRNMGVGEAPLDHGEVADSPEKALAAMTPEDQDESEEEMWDPKAKSGAETNRALDKAYMFTIGIMLAILAFIAVAALGPKLVMGIVGGMTRLASKSAKAAKKGMSN